MQPRPREWLGAGILTLVLVALIVLLVATATGGAKETEAALHALVGAVLGA